MAFVCNVCGWNGKDEDRVRASRAWIRAHDVDMDTFLTHRLNCPDCGESSWRLTGEDAEMPDGWAEMEQADEERRLGARMEQAAADAEVADLEDQLGDEDGADVTVIRVGSEGREVGWHEAELPLADGSVLEIQRNELFDLLHDPERSANDAEATKQPGDIGKRGDLGLEHSEIDQAGYEGNLADWPAGSLPGVAANEAVVGDRESVGEAQDEADTVFEFADTLSLDLSVNGVCTCSACGSFFDIGEVDRSSEGWECPRCLQQNADTDEDQLRDETSANVDAVETEDDGMLVQCVDCGWELGHALFVDLDGCPRCGSLDVASSGVGVVG